MFIFTRIQGGLTPLSHPSVSPLCLTPVSHLNLLSQFTLLLCFSLISQNAELSSSLKSLESSQQELEKTLVTLQNQYQQDKVNWQSQQREADGHCQALQKEVRTEVLLLHLRTFWSCTCDSHTSRELLL